MYQVLRRRQRNIPEEDVDGQVLEVPLDEFEGRARERRIYDVTLFCRSSAFADAGYSFDERRGIIYRDAA
jgi:DNA replication licensing factor MCM2